MDKNKNTPKRGFNNGIIGFGFMLLVIVLTNISNPQNVKVISMIIGLLIVVAMIAAIIGFVKSFKKLIDPNTDNKIYSVIINFGIIGLLSSIIIKYILEWLKS